MLQQYRAAIVAGGRKPATIPHTGGGWEGASARWQGDVFVPFEKLIAVLAVGQMMHIGIGQLLAWTRLNKVFSATFRGGKRRRPKSHVSYSELIKVQRANLKAHYERGDPVVLFRSTENPADPGTTVLLSQPALWLVGTHFNDISAFINPGGGRR